MEAMKVSEITTPDPSKRIGMISDLISETFFSHWRAQSIDDGPQADIHSSRAPGVGLNHSRMSALTLYNRANVTRDKLKFYAYVTDQAQSVTVGNATTMHVQPLELIILSSDVPCQIITPRAYTTSSLVIDADLFSEYVPNHQGLIARRLSYPFGLQEILNSTLDSCVAISTAGKFAEVGPRVVRSFLELLAVIAQQGPEAARPKLSTSLDIRRAQVKAFIKRYYHLPELNIAEVARHLQLTTRYVQLAFANEGTTPSEYLRQCRLEACAKQLRDHRSAHRNITDIAFSNGFNNSSHFSTEFKRIYGMSPRAWRANVSDFAPSSETPPVLARAHVT